MHFDRLSANGMRYSAMLHIELCVVRMRHHSVEIFRHATAHRLRLYKNNERMSLNSIRILLIGLDP